MTAHNADERRPLVVRGNASCLGLRDNSVDLIVTSPPYFALRSYQDGGEHYAGQVGAEATPAEFVAALLDCTREWMRVLKPSGSLWVNLGDKYAERGGPAREAFVDGGQVTYRNARPRRRGESETGIRQKSLMGLPWRYALGCIDELGLILRAEVIWSKPNGLPESVTDRVRRSHEQWFHFTLEPRYFSAVDEIREPHLSPVSTYTGGHAHRKAQAGVNAESNLNGSHPHPLGKLPGSVWTVPTEPLQVPDELGVDHFAAFPTEWPRQIVQGWSPSGICVECGEGRRPVVHTPRAADFVQQAEHEGQERARGGLGASSQLRLSGGPLQRWREANPTLHLGYECACPAPSADTRPAVVLDPFGGTGTTALVASVLGRRGITVDLSADYCRLARWRTSDPGERARAMRVPKPPKQTEGQADLFSSVTDDEKPPLTTEAVNVA